MRRRNFMKVIGPLSLATIAGCVTSTDTIKVSEDTTEDDIFEESSVFADADYLDSTLIIELDQYAIVNDTERNPVMYLTVGDPNGDEVERIETHYGVTKYRFPIESLQEGTYRAVATYHNEEDGDTNAETLLLEIGGGGPAIIGLENHY